MLDEIRKELQNAHHKDLDIARQYVGWLRFRRYANNLFFLLPESHWVRPPVSAHWIR